MTTMPTDEQLRAQIERLSQSDDDGNVILKKDEAIILREVVRAWVTAKALGRAAGILKKIAIWIVAVIAGYAAFKAGVLDWLGLANGIANQE